MNEWMDRSSRVFIVNLMHDDDGIQRHVYCKLSRR